MPESCEYSPATILHKTDHIHCVYNRTHFLISVKQVLATIAKQKDDEQKQKLNSQTTSNTTTNNESSFKAVARKTKHKTNKSVTFRDEEKTEIKTTHLSSIAESKEMDISMIDSNKIQTKRQTNSKQKPNKQTKKQASQKPTNIQNNMIQYRDLNAKMFAKIRQLKQENERLKLICKHPFFSCFFFFFFLLLFLFLPLFVPRLFVKCQMVKIK